WQPVMAGGAEEHEFDEEAWEAALNADPESAPNGPQRPGVAAHPARGPRRPPPPSGRPPAGSGPPTGGGEATPNKVKRQVMILSILTVVVLLIAVVGFVFARRPAKNGDGALAGEGGAR